MRVRVRVRTRVRVRARIRVRTATASTFYVATMQVSAVWEIDMFGGASIVSTADYFKAKP